MLRSSHSIFYSVADSNEGRTKPERNPNEENDAIFFCRRGCRLVLMGRAFHGAPGPAQAREQPGMVLVTPCVALTTAARRSGAPFAAARARRRLRLLMRCAHGVRASAVDLAALIVCARASPQGLPRLGEPAWALATSSH